MTDELPSERERPGECAVGDWVTAKSVPDWSIHERLHAHAFQDLASLPAPSIAPTTHPALTVLFEQSSLRQADGTEAVIWVRRE